MPSPNRYTVTIPVSFEANLQMTHKVRFPAKAKILKMWAQVTKALAGTDAGTITLEDAASTAMTNGQISFPASTVLATESSATPTTGQTIAAGSFCEVTTAKTTAGGTALVTIEYKLVP